MEQNARRGRPKDEKVSLMVGLLFEGSVSEIEKMMAELGTLPASGLKIGSWPTPEHPAGGMMIDTVPLPEIDTVPLPGRPPAGVWPVAQLLSKRLLDEVTEGMPHLKMVKDINGGIRNPHLHVEDEVVLLDRDKFKKVVRHVAMELADRLAESAEYAETVAAISHLEPKTR